MLTDALRIVCMPNYLLSYVYRKILTLFSSVITKYPDAGMQFYQNQSNYQVTFTCSTSTIEKLKKVQNCSKLTIKKTERRH